jgi:mRNA interferase MazF
MQVERGDLIWIDLDPRTGHEQGGHRPALVVSPSAYNDWSSFALICPITSNDKPWDFKVTLPEGGAVTGMVLVDQIRSVDLKARRAAPAGRVDETVLNEVDKRLRTLLQLPA